jgi:Protein of unknown function (DUF2752)
VRASENVENTKYAGGLDYLFRMSSAAGAVLEREMRARAAVGPYPLRALGILAAWGLCALPPALGAMRCPVALFTHHACPGCGMTRAARLLLHGDLAGSLHMHAFALPQLFATGLVVLATTWAAYRTGTPTDMLASPVGRAAAKLFVAAQALLLLYYLARAVGAFGGLPPV